MNKIYRTVWNASLGAFVAASELDQMSGRGKPGLSSGVCDSRARNGRAVSALTGSGPLAVLSNRDVSDLRRCGRVPRSCACASWRRMRGSG